MRENYAVTLFETLKWEGGKVNHPDDPGGRTNKGVIQRTYDAYRRRKGLPTRSVYDITDTEVAEIYKTGYADPIHFDQLPGGLDSATFDGGVNSGPSRSAKWLQRAIQPEYKGKIDGIVGHGTLAAAEATENTVAAVKRLCGYRLGFVQALKTWKTFGKGWARRIAGVEAFSVKLAVIYMASRGKIAETAKPTVIKDVLETEQKNAEEKKKAADKGAVTSGTASAGSGGATQAEKVDPGFNVDETTLYILVAVSVIMAVIALLFIFKSRVQKARAEAYKAEATRS